MASDRLRRDLTRCEMYASTKEGVVSFCEVVPNIEGDFIWFCSLLSSCLAVGFALRSEPKFSPLV